MWQASVKRAVDLAIAIVGLVVTSPLIILAVIALRLLTGEAGIFVQQRIGRDGKAFPLLKLRTMRSASSVTTTVTTRDDPRIIPLGAILRQYKIDELPQLLNVLLGDMSLVGPRPDVPGYADRLAGPDLLMLAVRPGITGPAALAYRDEEILLASVEDPIRYNREIVWPDKVRMNCNYVRNFSLRMDMVYIMRTLVPAVSLGRRTEM